MRNIALVGDYSAEVPAHRAIPLALEKATRELQLDVSWKWMASRELRDPSRDLALASGLWIVPGSPYENAAGVLHAIRWARETKRPLLGTCGGFQHVLLEFARNVLHLTDADHAETNPTGEHLVVTRLACPLVEQRGNLHFAPGSQLQRIYGHTSAREAYHCNFGPAAGYRAMFERAGLRFTAFDEAGEPRAAELLPALHPFFLGTLFQSERAALAGQTPPVARAFVQAAADFAL